MMSNSTSGSIRDAIEDNSEAIIDKFSKKFLNSEVANIVGEFPVTSTAKGIAAGVYGIANWRISRNIQYFLEGLKSGEATQEDYERLSEKYGREKLLENALLSLESMRSERQALAFSFLFDAFAKGELEWKRYCELQNILEKIDPLALDNDFNNGKEPTYRLITVGLAYIQTVLDGVRVVPNGKLYNDFKKFVIVPYKNSIK